MSTTSRGYDLIPADPAPNVPYYVNPTLEQIDADVQGVADAAAGAVDAAADAVAAAATAKTEAIAEAAAGAAAGDAALDVRLEAVEAVVPAPAPAANDKYAYMTLDQAGKLVQGELYDGTQHIPHLLADRITLGESTRTVGAVDGYRSAIVTQDDRLLFGEREDGTIHIPHLETSLINGQALTPATDYRIVIVAGQSNSLFRFNTDGPQLTEPNPRIKWWNRLTSTMTDLSPNVTPSLVSGFVEQYAKDHPDVTQLIVPVTVGSTGFKTSSIVPTPAGYLASTGTWDRNLTADPNNLALRLLSSLAGALAATGGAEVVAMLWSQGESDRTRMTESEYAAALDDLIGQVWATIGQEIPVVVTSFTPEEIAAPQYSGTEGIIKALEGVQARLHHTAYHWGPANMVTYGEQIHWNPEGNRLRGAAIARDTLRRARLNVDGSLPQSPTNPKAVRAGDQVTISWEYPYARTTGFVLETSPDGVTWTTQTLARPYATQHTITSAPALRARIKATNEVGTSYATLEVTA